MAQGVVTLYLPSAVADQEQSLHCDAGVYVCAFLDDEGEQLANILGICVRNH